MITNIQTKLEAFINTDISPKDIEDITVSIIKNEIIKSNETGFIDYNIDSNLALRPKLVINDYTKGNKVLSEIIYELSRCSEFMISVAFITLSGLTPLLETFKSLQEKGVKGTILTTDYLNFSEPKALRKLLNFSNLQVKLYSKESFHTKGYIFKHKDYYKLLIGSSNLTGAALTKNKEWNLIVSSLENGALTSEVVEEFKTMYKEADALTLDLIDTYEQIYLAQREATRKSKVPTLTQHKLTPNKMQVAAVSSLNKLRENNVTKALLISATGTGKTFLSAFDVRNFEAKRILFIVHREQIARQALNSFENVFGDTKTFGLLSGTHKEINRDFTFATVQTLSKEEVLQSFDKKEFDYIIIDEVHKAGAESYQKIASYFEPKFLLGMSATPERNDDFDIFKMFDYKVAYEIRLQQALEHDLLCPFHYFGIRDIDIEGDEINNFSSLISDERVKHIVDKINFYGYSGDRVKGLIFCSRNSEALELSKKFNSLGYKTVDLTGDSSQKERDEAVERLEQDKVENSLDYIFTVDIFNEGVDIPTINQVIMLRPTKSAIIFVQQLGRGLRKKQPKEYVVVIDFVGNYDSNFLIPIALSGDRSYNKDTIRKYVMEGSRLLPGCSTINFDEISKQRIFEAIDKANFNDVKLIKENYLILKQKIGKIPSLKDFDCYEAMDPIRIFDNNGLGSYHRFLTKYEKEYTITLTPTQELFVEFISKKLAAGKRVQELETIKCAMEYKTNIIHTVKKLLKEEYSIDFKATTETCIVNVLTNEFPSGTGKKTYNDCIFLEKSGADYCISKTFDDTLKDDAFKEIVEELIDFGISRYKNNYSKSYLNTNFQLYQKYTYEDVCRLLDWERGEVALNIGGYKFDKTTKTYPVFINYNKSEEINASINYEDRFESPSHLIALSKNGRTASSDDVVQAYNAERDGVEMFLFVRKNKDDKSSKEFYFLGKIKAVGEPLPVTIKDTGKSAVEITYQLYTPVRNDIFDYIIS